MYKENSLFFQLFKKEYKKLEEFYHQNAFRCWIVTFAIVMLTILKISWLNDINTWMFFLLVWGLTVTTLSLETTLITALSLFLAIVAFLVAIFKPNAIFLDSTSDYIVALMLSFAIPWYKSVRKKTRTL